MTNSKHRPKAFYEFDRMVGLLALASETELLSGDEVKRILEAGMKVVADQGGIGTIESLDPSNPSHLALTKHAVHLMKSKFLEIQPGLEVDLDAWFETGRSR